MYDKDKLNDLYERTVKAIDISDDLFEAAETEYTDLGIWIDAETPDYKIYIYPQGSFALGTVIKPISDTDDYDLDLVCEFEKQYGLSAETLKCNVVKPLLEKYRKIKDEIINKRRCWHVEYEEVPNFHMDIIPAINRIKHIDITDHDEENDLYNYIGSNPRGYIDWFNDKKSKQRQKLYERYIEKQKQVIICQAEVKRIPEYKLKTTLQKAIQLLKRHRDIMFKDDTNNLKPISIIITTIAAELYDNEDNIVDTLKNILQGTEEYIKSHMIGNEYHIDNPSYTGDDIENFADKWNEHPERAKAFFDWISVAQQDLISDDLYKHTRIEMGNKIKKVFGNTTGKRVFDIIAEEDHMALKEQQKKLNPILGSFTATGTIPVPPNRHYGK